MTTPSAEDTYLPRTTDWYARRNELQSGQVFRMYDGSIVRLERTKPGDGTAWIVANWEGNGWFNDEGWIEPGDLVDRLSDNFPG